MPPDLVITDALLGDLNGPELVAVPRTHSLNRNALAVVLTVDQDAALRAEMLRGGHDRGCAYINVPFELWDRLHGLFRSHW